MKKIDTEASKVVKSSAIWFLIISASVITVYFNVDLQDPFNTPKLIVLVLSSSWLLGHLLNFIRIDNLISKNDYLVLITCSIFILAMFISFLFTDVKITGLIGDNQRRNGLLDYLSLTVLFLFSYFSMNFIFAIRLIKVGIISGIILGSYGVLQIMGKDFVRWNNPYNSMISTLGNPNFASAILAVFFLIALFSLRLKKLSKFFKLLAILVLCLALYAIIKSSSRQGLLVILFGAIFYICLSAYLNRSRFRYAITSFLVLVSILTIMGMLQHGPFTQFLYKDSVSVRGFYWRAGMKMFLDHPLFGVGLDRYGAYFKEYREVNYPLRYGYEITSSNAHNVFIQLFATGGFFVGLLYLLLLLLVLIKSTKLAKHSSDENRRVILALLAAWFGFQAQSLISIDNIGISVWGWLLGGTLLGLNRQSLINLNNQSNGSGKKVRNRTVEINLFQPITSSIILLVTLLVCVPIYNFERQANIIRGVLSTQDQGKNNMVQKYSQKINSNSLADPYYKFQSALALSDIGALSSSFKCIYNLYLKDPRNLDYLDWLANYYEKQQDTKNAILFRNMISKYDQWNASNYLILGNLYKQTGDLKSMQLIRDKILSFARSTDIGKIAIAELI